MMVLVTKVLGVQFFLKIFLSLKSLSKLKNPKRRKIGKINLKQSNIS